MPLTPDKRRDDLPRRAYAEYFDPQVLATIEDLELLARGVVEGFKHGLHRSPYVGFSIEFASHREYLPGDDLRHINWKAYGRQDRLYIKQYDAETNLDLHLIVDASRSMVMASGAVTKLRYAVMLAASIAHLALTQRDAAGLTLYADKVLEHVRPRAHPDQLLELLLPLARTRIHPACDSPRVLHEVADLMPRRGLVVLLGDFFFEGGELAKCFEHLRHNGHDVLVFHILDPIERDLSVDGAIRFVDLETGQEVVAQAHELRKSYERAMTQWQAELLKCCNSHDIDYVQLTTQDPLDKGLVNYLATRSEMY